MRSSRVMRVSFKAVDVRRRRPDGWGGRIRTFEYGIQSPAPYRLATPQRSRTSALLRRVLGRLRGRCLRSAAGAGLVRADLLPIHGEDFLLQVLAHLVVERMRDVLEGPVLALLARHRDEQALGPVDDLDVG